MKKITLFFLSITICSALSMQAQLPDTLMDEPLKDNPQMFEALSAYKPNGIPAKVIIDPNGKQRFLATGFSSDTELINEINAMIQLVREQY